MRQASNPLGWSDNVDLLHTTLEETKGKKTKKEKQAGSIKQTDCLYRRR